MMCVTIHIYICAAIVSKKNAKSLSSLNSLSDRMLYDQRGLGGVKWILLYGSCSTIFILYVCERHMRFQFGVSVRHSELETPEQF